MGMDNLINIYPTIASKRFYDNTLKRLDLLHNSRFPQLSLQAVVGKIMSFKLFYQKYWQVKELSFQNLAEPVEPVPEEHLLYFSVIQVFKYQL